MAFDALPPPPAAEIIVVHPAKLPPSAGEIAFSAVRLSAEALAKASRLDEALFETPGVSLFRRTSSLSANPTTQGLTLRAIAPSGAGRALVTLDGVPQNDPFGGWVIWSALPAEALDGATIVRGSGSGPYGAGALTGVVAFSEREAQNGLLAAGLSVSDTSGARVGAALGAAGGESDLLISGASETTRGYRAVRGSAGGAADTRLDLTSWGAAVRAQHAFGPITAALRIAAYDENRGAGLDGARSTADGTRESLTLARQPQHGVLGWRLQGWAQQSGFTNTSVALAPDRSAATPANDQYATPAHGYGFNAALRGLVGYGTTWELGGDIRRYDGESREYNRNLGAGFTRERRAGGVEMTAGLYAELTREAGPWLFTGNLRADYWSSSEARRIERDLATGATLLDQTSPDKDGVAPTGRLGLRRAIAEGLYVRAAAYAGFRQPTLNELHRPFRVGNDITEANPNLKPERLYGAEIGLSGSGIVRWSGAVFYNLLKDPVANVTIGFGPGTFPVAGFVPAGGVLRQRSNAGHIDAYGFEGEAEVDVGPGLTLRAALGATHARVDGEDVAPQLTGLRPAQAPALTATFGATWRATEALALSLQGRYESARFDDDLNTRTLDPATLIDARAAWRFSQTTEAFVAADNLFDADIGTATSAAGVISYAAPRTIRVGVAMRR